MKLKSMLSLGVLISISALSLNTYAAPEMDKSEMMKEPAQAVQSEPSTAMKRHSHVEEKTGVPQKMPLARAEKTKSIPDTSKHYHPRDGK